MCYRPALLLADEPTGNLDRRNSAEILDLLRRCHRDLGQTILLVTHDERLAAQADRVITPERRPHRQRPQAGVRRMWKDFSRSYLARNRAAGWTVAAAALAAAFFLSLLCSLAYNLWVYEIRRITQEEGGWHARVTVAQDGGQPDETLQKLTQFANVETAVLSPAPAAEGSAIIELTFRDRGEHLPGPGADPDALAAAGGCGPGPQHAAGPLSGHRPAGPPARRCCCPFCWQCWRGGRRAWCC